MTGELGSKLPDPDDAAEIEEALNCGRHRPPQPPRLHSPLPAYWQRCELTLAGRRRPLHRRHEGGSVRRRVRGSVPLLPGEQGGGARLRLPRPVPGDAGMLRRERRLCASPSQIPGQRHHTPSCRTARGGARHCNGCSLPAEVGASMVFLHVVSLAPAAGSQTTSRRRRSARPRRRRRWPTETKRATRTPGPAAALMANRPARGNDKLSSTYFGLIMRQHTAFGGRSVLVVRWHLREDLGQHHVYL